MRNFFLFLLLSPLTIVAQRIGMPQGMFSTFIYNYSGYMIDGEYLSLGSVNFDIRSMHHNFEITALIYTKKDVEKYLHIYDNDELNSERFDEVYERKYLKRYRVGRKVFKLLSTLM